jgi:hypothetical protein
MIRGHSPIKFQHAEARTRNALGNSTEKCQLDSVGQLLADELKRWFPPCKIDQMHTVYTTRRHIYDVSYRENKRPW